ncbi:NUDIX hydrolase [Staphylococcus simulans]|uniref:NUDIX hydrolase n=1 Tax=Staphylococcus simulans TaxID=1286 RepID=UPI001E5325AB|nr:NUDIX hydrolase [Staphylococcus simulans]MCD8915073.1 NUDIX hydrolase [Staphylococcus simulans]
MDFTEKTLHKQSIYKGKIIDVDVDEVLLPNGETSKREIVNHTGAVAVCALTPENKVVLVKQFRKPIEKVLLEIPAGKLEEGEEPKSAAYRELEEETGYIAHDLKQIADIYTSPGFANEKIAIYFTDNLSKGEVHLDPDEFVEQVELTIDEIKDLVQNQQIEDAKTLIALQHLLSVYNHSK